MKKPRIIVVLTAAALSALLLFGGWMIYNQTAVAAPIEKAMDDLPGVIHYDKPVRDQKQVKIGLELNKGANVREIYNAIRSKAASAIGDRELKLDIRSNDDAELESIWQSSLFAIAQAMESKTYSEIPDIMSKAAASNEKVQAVTEIDDSNVYITLIKESSVKYIVLPRVPTQLEVWNNA